MLKINITQQIYVLPFNLGYHRIVKQPSDLYYLNTILVFHIAFAKYLIYTFNMYLSALINVLYSHWSFICYYGCVFSLFSHICNVYCYYGCVLSLFSHICNVYCYYIGSFLQKGHIYWIFINMHYLQPNSLYSCRKTATFLLQCQELNFNHCETEEI